MDEYDKLLDNAYKNMPERSMHKERFEIPAFDLFSEGNKTVVRNFGTVAAKLRREKTLLLKWLSRELAVPINEDGERAILQRRISSDIVNKKLEEFTNKFVICKECKKPDTKVTEMGHGIKKLVCEACGARTTIS